VAHELYSSHFAADQYKSVSLGCGAATGKTFFLQEVLRNQM
jgi:hypothetical protein